VTQPGSNLEIIRDGFEHFISTGELAFEVFDPAVVWDMSTFRGWPEDQEYLGIEGVGRFLASWTAPFEDWRLEVEEFVDAPPDRVVVLLHQYGRSAGAGIETEMRFGHVWHMREGRAVRVNNYASPEEAKAAARQEDR
jgi:ketosteroid isomerase-like protein